MTCKRIKGGVLCGDFAPEDSKWHDMGYLGSMHKCGFCPNAARFVSREKGRKDRYCCSRCKESHDA